MGGQSLGLEDPLEKEIVIHPNILACKIAWTEEPDGSQRVGHDSVTKQQQQTTKGTNTGKINSSFQSITY